MCSLLLALLLGVRLSAGPPLPQGQVIEQVVCEGAPRFSYAAYIPTSFQAGKPVPVLFGISPGGDGREPVRLFQAAAERHGWIVVGSNDAHNGPLEPALEALAVLWKDVKNRFPVDLPRSASVGFSGGSRLAFHFLRLHPELGGVIQFGAFGIGPSSLSGLKGHAAVLLCGNEDWAHWEMVEAIGALKGRGWRAWSDRYAGGHRWPEASWADAALDFLELDAMAQKRRPEDAALRKAFLEQRVTGARTAEGLLAQRRWETVRDLGAAAEAEPVLARLKQDPSLERERSLEAQATKVAEEMERIRWKAGYGQLLQAQLERSRGADPLEALQARRILESEIGLHNLAVSEALQRKDFKTAEALARNYAALRPDESRPRILQACAIAGQGRLEEAVEVLKVAQAKGHRFQRDPRTFPGLERLAGHPAAEALFAAMGQPAPVK